MTTLSLVRPALVMATVVCLGLPELLALRRARARRHEPRPPDHEKGRAGVA